MAEGSTTESSYIPGEEIIAGYQHELAEANHKIIVLGAQSRVLQRQLREALEENENLKKSSQEQDAERNSGASASDQEASE